MKTILIVDDDVCIGDMLQEVLAKEGYRTARPPGLIPGQKPSSICPGAARI